MILGCKKEDVNDDGDDDDDDYEGDVRNNVGKTDKKLWILLANKKEGRKGGGREERRVGEYWEESLFL